MPETVMALYSRLPPTWQSVAASLRGLYLRHWRRGPGFERLVEEVLDRDRWSADRWRHWQEERLAAMLARAATQVPFYREQWRARRQRGDRASVELLANWPILEKAAFRADPRAFVADDVRVERLFHERTSGTTGTPLDVWRSRDTLTRLYAMAEARTHHWTRTSPTARYARLGGQLVVPVSRRTPPFWVWNAPMRQLYLSTYHLSRELLPHYLDALARYRIEYLAGYPSAVALLAHEALRQGRRLPMRAVFTNAEGVDAAQRTVIERAFDCHVHETYGQAEMVTGASECDEGTLHLWPETGVPELVEGDAPVPLESGGELIATGLLNPDMPLIRYRVGDRVRFGAPQPPCACGRALPRIAAVEGRTQDLLHAMDGRRVFWLNPVYYGLPIREAQIIQRRIESVEVRVVPGTGFDAGTHGRLIEARLRERLGPVEVDLRLEEHIARTANGKLRPVICQIAEDPTRAQLTLGAAR